MAAEVARMPFRLPRLGWLALAGAALWCVLAVIWPSAFLRGWLAVVFLVSGSAVGTLVLCAMMQLIPGLWDEELEPSAQRVAAFTPFAALLFLPILIGAGWLYPWEASGGKGAFREVWMMPFFWGTRAILFWLFAAGYGLILQKNKASPSVVVTGLILLILFFIPIAVDWFLFLDPEAHFSGFALTVLASFFLNALCVSILLALVLGTPMKRPEILGSLLLAALLSWAYFGFMQYFITWSDNLPFGVHWYERRAVGAWGLIEMMMVALHLLPLLLLLFGPVRRGVGWISGLCCVVLAGSALEALWLVVPGETRQTLAMLAALLAAGVFGCAASRVWSIRHKGAA